MSFQNRISQPSDLKQFSSEELRQIAQEIRSFLIAEVSKTGGHLGPNLGVVELTIALHRVFDSPNDPIIFDTGHQSYVHKWLSGRADRFSTLRKTGGLSGYPSRAESQHDWVENSHASTALSWAAGLASASKLRGLNNTVVALVGDGSLTGGMAWEALNNISDNQELPLVIVINDNGRSYTPTVGGLAHQLTKLRTDRRYESTLRMIKKRVQDAPLVGRPFYALLHGLKAGIKDWLAPQTLFSDLNIKYVGPLDGHDIDVLIDSFEQAKNFGQPVIIHAITQKGAGFPAAENDDRDRFHAVGQIDAVTGAPLAKTPERTWTDAFGGALVDIGKRYPHVVALTAAMLHPTGLGEFAQTFPERTFDVGIAEQHAMTSAAGLAAGGLHPVFAVYATFVNRAFDQLLMDVALHRAGVTVVLDRSGITGPDGPSHHGMWDVSLASMIPGAMLACPRDANHLESVLDDAINVDDRPTLVRYSKQTLPQPIPALRTIGDGHASVDVLSADEDSSVLVIGYGQFSQLGQDCANQLRAKGVRVCVADPRWALPISSTLTELANAHDVVVTIEDSLLVGGLGACLEATLSRETNVVRFGLPTEFIDQGSRDDILAKYGLSADAIVNDLDWLTPQR